MVGLLSASRFACVSRIQYYDTNSINVVASTCIRMPNINILIDQSTISLSLPLQQTFVFKISFNKKKTQEC